MATLAAQIETDLQILHPTEQLKDWTNRRSLTAPGSLSVNAAVLTRTCELAAAEVSGVLGDVDGDDTIAVSFGCELAVAKFLNPQSPSLDRQEPQVDGILRRIRTEAERRRAETDPYTPSTDFAQLNERYPGEDWEDV